MFKQTFPTLNRMLSPTKFTLETHMIELKQTNKQTNKQHQPTNKTKTKMNQTKMETCELCCVLTHKNSWVLNYFPTSNYLPGVISCYLYKQRP